MAGRPYRTNTPAFVNRNISDAHVMAGCEEVGEPGSKLRHGRGLSSGGGLFRRFFFFFSSVVKFRSLYPSIAISTSEHFMQLLRTHTTYKCTYDLSMAISGDFTHKNPQCYPHLSPVLTDLHSNGTTWKKRCGKMWRDVDGGKLLVVRSADLEKLKKLGN